MSASSTLTSIAVLTLAAAFSLPAQADPPPWAPAHGHRAKQKQEHRYVYYPARQVYYSPTKQVWFWMSGGNWQVGVHLPAQLRSAVDDGVHLTLASERPYSQHVYVEEHYGRPWREKHKEKHEGKHEHKKEKKHKQHE